METQLLDALEKGITNGARSLSQRGLGLSAKTKPILDQLLTNGFVEANKNKYDVTEKGLSFWEEKSNPSHHQQIRNNIFQKFLEAVQAKNGKKLTATSLRSCPPEWREEAVKEGLIEKAGTDTFRLLPEGVQFLDQVKIKNALAELREQQQTLEAKIVSLNENVLASCATLEAELVGDVANKFQQKIEAHCTAFRALISEFDAHNRFTQIAQQLQAKVRQEQNAVLEKVDHIQKEMSKFEQFREELVFLQSRFSTLQSDFRENADRLEQEIRTLSVVRPPSANGNGLAKIDVEKAILDELHTWRQEHSPKSYPLPQMYDKLSKKIAQLTIGQFHDALRHLHKDNRIDLRSFTQAMYQLPHPEYVLLVGREMKYYVDAPNS